MKRRTFTLGLGALFAAPLMPAPAVAAVPTAVTEKFAAAKLLARCHDRASPEMLGRLMRVDGETARGLFKLLQDRGVLQNGLDGVARAANPLNTHCVPNEAIRARNLAQQVAQTREKVRNIWNKVQEHTAEPETTLDAAENEMSELADTEIETEEVPSETDTAS